MVKVVFKHFGYKKYSYVTNANAKITKVKTEATVEFTDTECKDYSILIKRKKIYETAACYFNIINPFLYLWRFKVLFNPENEFGTALNWHIITFCAANGSADLAFVLNDDAPEKAASCTQNTGALNLKVKKTGVSQKIKRRFMITNIANTLLWTLAVAFLMLLPGAELSFAGIVAALLIVIGNSAYTIYQIIRQSKLAGINTKNAAG